MGKIRVYHVARELGMTSAELMEKLKALDFDVKNHMCTLTESEAERIRAAFRQEEEVQVDEVRIKPNIIRRRRKAAAKPVVEEVEKGKKEEPEAPPEQEPPPVSGPGLAEEAPAAEAKAEEEVKKEEEKVAPQAPPTEAAGEAAAVEEGKAEEGVKAIPSEKPVPEVEAAPPVTPPKKVERPAKPVAPVKKAERLEEEPVEERVGKKRRPSLGKKVVEYKVKRKRDFVADLEEGREPHPRRRVDVRRERRGAKRPAKKPVLTVPKATKRKIRMGESITVGELAKRLSVKAAEVIKKLMENQIVANINQSIDFDTAALIASDYGYEVESILTEEKELLPEEETRPETAEPRPPVVTVMGHVNHGKTRLLDSIRKTHVMEKEAGGITQRIGAYTVDIGGRHVVFLDTPGHEAFTNMRARGAQVTDIVVLVVAADDGVMPQTIEAINHAKAANVPIIVAINKVDLPNVNVERVKQGLAEQGLIPEEWGGETLVTNISAKEGTGIPELLDLILLQAEMLELTADPSKKAKGLIIEARLDRTLGTVATVLVQEGTLHVGDPFVAGLHHGKVRALLNDRGKMVKSAGPSMPVEVLGCSGVPEAGDTFHVVEDEKKAKVLSQIRMEKARETGAAVQGKMSLEDLYERIRQDQIEELTIILKADVQGSVEALTEALERLSTDEVRVKILHSGVGGVREADVMLASASNALIIGFNVRAEPKAMSLAEQEKVDVRFYTVIYDVVADVKAAMEGLLKPVFKETLLGRAEVRETFNMHRVGTIAGSYVVDGKMTRNARVRLLRDNVVIHDGKIASLRRFKDDVKEVTAGYECGIRLEDFNDIKVGDIIESYAMEQVSGALEAKGQAKRPS